MLEKFIKCLEDNGIYDLAEIREEDFDKVFDIKDEFLTNQLEVMSYDKVIALLGNHIDMYKFNDAYTEAYDCGWMNGEFLKDMRMAFNAYYNEILCDYLNKFGIK